MRKSVKSVVGVGTLAAVLGLAAMPSAWAQPENPRPVPGRQPGRNPQNPGQPGQPGGPGERQEGGRQQMSVGAAMRQMNRALSMYEEAMQDKSKAEEALMSVYALERACASCKLAPAPREATKEQISAFREAQLELIKLVVELEEAQLNEDHDACAELVESIKEFRDESHKAFGVTDDEEPGRRPDDAPARRPNRGN